MSNRLRGVNVKIEPSEPSLKPLSCARAYSVILIFEAKEGESALLRQRRFAVLRGWVECRHSAV